MLLYHFLNVGKGNCTIIEFPSRNLSVIDIDNSKSLSSRESMKIVLEKRATPSNPIEYITSNFDYQDIFRFILTHPDMDHLSGIKELFDLKNIYNFWDAKNNKNISSDDWDNSPYSKEDWDFYQEMKNKEECPKYLNLYRGSKSDCCWVQDGIEILSPNQELINHSEETEEYDNLSYVLMIEYQSIKAIIPGDATILALNNIIENYDEDMLKADILLAPGHGSKNHVCKDFLDIVKPRLTIVSVAEGVDYDLETYKKYGRVLSTKHYGNVKVKIKNNGEITFRTQFQNYGDNWYILKDRGSYYGV